MEAGVPNSFIPQDATSIAKPLRRYESGGLAELVGLISLILFVASIALAAGAFIYKQVLDGQSASKLQSIQSAQQQFDPQLVQQLTQLNLRMETAESLLSAHLAPTSFFTALSQSTLQTVSFKTLDYEAPDAQHVTIKMQGVAQDVNSIALQAQLFGQNGIIENPIFSDIDPEIDGVHFDLTADVNPSALKYELLASGGTTSSVNPLPAQTQQTSNASTPAVASTTSTGAGQQGSQQTTPQATLPTGSQRQVPAQNH